MTRSTIATARWPGIAAALFAIPFLAFASPAVAAPLESMMPAPTPLILKDGRIAHVTVHTIPFSLKSAELDGDTRSRVERLLVPMATDCFLTAQAIGHVQPGDQADGDTLSAHRLARARADGIQESLIGLGLPASSVASVWDWQFMVKEPRVTLWVFRLHQGEDCEGKPISGAVVASLDKTAGGEGETARAAAQKTDAAPRPLTPPKETAAPSTQAPASGAAASAEPEIVAEDVSIPGQPKPLMQKETEIARIEAPVAEAPVASVTSPPRDLTMPPAVEAGEVRRTLEFPAPTHRPAGAERIEPAPLTEADTAPIETAGQMAGEAVAGAAASASGAAQAVEETAAAAAASTMDGLQPETPAVAVAAATPEPVVEQAPAQPAPSAPSAAETAITFAVNSSFFGGNGARTLSQLLDNLDPGQSYRVELSGAVGSDPVRGGDATEARKYNLWMAERRVERIAEWLAENGGARNLTIDRNYRENDPSRTVNVTVRPAT